MEKIDVRFDEQMIAVLKSMVGTNLIQIRKPMNDKVIFFIAGIRTDSGWHALTNLLEVRDYFGVKEDVAVFRLEEYSDEKYNSLVKNLLVKIVDIPINQRIREIQVINEHQMLFCGDEQIYDVWLTRGVIFILDDGFEVAFEKSVWFSEFIYFIAGESVIKKFIQTSNFLDAWEAPCRGECERVALTLRAE